MKRFIVTSLQAARLPRWVPLVICAVYIVAGLFGRDPWRTQDAIGFGVAHTLATQGGLSWLVPNVHGIPVMQGPLPGWLGALAIHLGDFLSGGWITADLALRALAAIQLALALALVWYSVLDLARRPQVQPDDPFGIRPSSKDFGRAVADTALLATLASIGLLARVHETTALGLQVLWLACLLRGLSWTLERPALGAALTAFALGATLLTRGLPLAIALCGVTALLLAAIPAWRLVARDCLRVLLPATAVGLLFWPVGLWLLGSGRVTEWFGFGVTPEATRTASLYLDDWLRSAVEQVSGPTERSLTYALRNMPWFFWPLWPFVARGIWSWRHSRQEPLLALPLALGIFCGLLAFLDPLGTEATLLPLIIPLAILTAMAIPTIPRGVVAVVDWFAISLFSVAGLFVWVYWIAFAAGFPPRMAASVQRLVPGFDATWSVLALLLGGFATLAWLALVRWRLSRPRHPIWAPMTLSAGGTVLTWFLLMSLWLPAANYRNTYRDLAAETRNWLKEGGCVQPNGLDAGQRALFAYYAGARFIELPAIRPSASGIALDSQGQSLTEPCRWLLVSERSPRQHQIDELMGDWVLFWKGQPAVNRGERLYLYARADWTRSRSR